MILRLFDEAVGEAARAMGLYEEAETGLGRGFRSELDQVIEKIVAQPLLHPAR